MILWAINFLIIFILFCGLGLKFLINIDYRVIEFNAGYLLGADIQYLILLDWISCNFIGVVFFISRIVLFYRRGYIGGDLNWLKFTYLVVLFVFSIVFIVVRPNIVSILLGWDGLGLVSYCLVIFYQSERARYAGIITVLTNRIGDIGIVLRLVFIVNFYSWSFREFIAGDRIIWFVGVLMFFGAITKRAQIPFSAWLPAAIAAPTPVSALVHSSTLVTAGVYLILRLRIFFSSGQLREVLMGVSVLTIFIAGLGANFETDLKRIIALSTLSQLGVIILALSLGFYEVAFFHLIAHAVFKAMLFLCAGVIIHGVGGRQDIRSIGIIFDLSPLIRGSVGLARISLAGFPFLSGFYSRDLVLEVLYVRNRGLILILLTIISVILTVLYSLRLIYYGLWSSCLNLTLCDFRERGYFNFPIFFMGCLVVILGCGFSWCCFPHPVFIHLTLGVRICNIILVSLGCIIYAGLFHIITWKRGSLRVYYNFVALIWFLPFVRRAGALRLGFNGVFFFKSRDQGWMEELGAQGISGELGFLSHIIHFFQLVGIKVVFTVFILILLILVI